MLSTISRTFSSFRRCRQAPPVKGYIPIPGKSPKIVKSAAEAVSYVKSGQRVFIHCIAACPQELLKALSDRAPELRNVEITGIFPTYPSKVQPLQTDDEAHRKAFLINQHFVGPHDRIPIGRKYPHPCFIPMLLNEVPQHLRSPDFPIDIALMQVSPPDKHGWCSLGPSVVLGRPGVDAAKFVIAEVNPQIPRTLGNSMVHYSHLDVVYETNRKLPQYGTVKLSDEIKKIGKNIAEIIPDGACLQAGVGGIPDAALLFLKNHKNLGVHTEMFSEGLIDLIESGAVNGSMKVNQVGKITTGFVMGTDRLYKYIDDNPMFHFDSSSYTNDPYVISQNPRAVSINAGLQVDLTGQVCADTFGPRQFSGVGGQADFMRGAALSEGGMPIMALPSTAANGKISRIVACLDKGASVTTSRWIGAIVVTEYGVAHLWGKNARQRAQALINIAHPKFREDLAKQAAEMYGVD